MDPYEWMENLEDERILKLVNEENKRFRDYVDGLSDKLVDEIRHYYYLPTIWEAKITKKGIIAAINEQGKQVVKNLSSGEILIDSKDLEKELKDEVLLQGFSVDEHLKFFAYNFSIGGSDEGITRIVNLGSGEVEEIKPSINNIIFLRDGYYFSRFYRKEVSPDGMKPPVERLFWKDKNGEKMVFGEGLDSNYFMYIKKSDDGKYAILTKTFGWNSSEIYLGPIENPEKWKKVYKSEVPAEPIDIVDGKLYVLTREGSGYGKIIAIGGDIEEVVPEGEYPLEWAEIVNGKILAGYLVDASSKLKLFSLEGKKVKEIKFEPAGKVIPFDSKDGILLKYESFNIPSRLYEFKDSMRIIHETKIEGEYNIKEDFVRSKDGTNIHYFLVEGENKNNIAWVFGYGGFNISLSPRFFPHVVPFLKRGGTFVVANLRGGGEYGEEWHRAGMRDKKQNVFDDFISVLEKLKKDYKVVAWGRSNGGLLVAATLVQRPDVMDAAIIGYPVIDMLRFHRMYIGRVWIPEYGNPDEPEDRKFLEKYSPYHNVKKKIYPPIMIYTGLHDDRVHPAHALKFFMKLREVDAPVYLRVETKSGHMGASPETRIKELADILAFVLKSTEVLN